MITSWFYILAEVVILAMLPVLMMKQIPILFAKRHFVLIVGVLYIGLIAFLLHLNLVSALQLNYSAAWIKTMVLPTAACMLLTLFLYSLRPTQVTKMTKTVNFGNLPWYAPLILYPLLSVPIQEILFRWYAFGRLSPLFGTEWLLIVTSLIFATIHIPFGSKTMVIGTFVMGLWWGFLYLSTGSLWPSTLSHAFIGTYLMWLSIGKSHSPSLKAITYR